MLDAPGGALLPEERAGVGHGGAHGGMRAPAVTERTGTECEMREARSEDRRRLSRACSTGASMAGESGVFARLFRLRLMAVGCELNSSNCPYWGSQP